MSWTDDTSPQMTRLSDRIALKTTPQVCWPYRNSSLFLCIACGLSSVCVKRTTPSQPQPQLTQENLISIDPDWPRIQSNRVQNLCAHYFRMFLRSQVGGWLYNHKSVCVFMKSSSTQECPSCFLWMHPKISTAVCERDQRMCWQ